MNRTIIAVSVSAAVIVMSGYAKATPSDQPNFVTKGEHQSLKEHVERTDGLAWAAHNAIGANTYMDEVRAADQALVDADQNETLSQLGDYAFEDYGSYEKHFGGQKGVNAHLEGSIGDVREVNDHQYRYLNGLKKDDEKIRERLDSATADRGRIESESVERDEVLAGQIQTVDDNSRDRDEVLGAAIDHNTAVNHAYRQQTAEQFTQQGAAIDSNRQAINEERQARQEMGKDLTAGIATAIAIGSHAYDVSGYRGLQMSIAGGAYRGESAASLGFGGAVSDRVFLNGSISQDSRGNTGFGAAANFKL